MLKLDTAAVRKINLNKIRRIMYSGEEYTKQKISVETGLSVATCNTLLNVLEKNGEITGRKMKLNDVGRNTVIYQMNENYETFLCLSLQTEAKNKSIHAYVITSVGRILYDKVNSYTNLTIQTLNSIISEILGNYSNVSNLIIGTSGVTKEGKILYSELPELESKPLNTILKDTFGIFTHTDNNMHFRTYGYCQKNKFLNKIVTLVYFSQKQRPEMCTIYKGTILRGKDGFAGALNMLHDTCNTNSHPFEYNLSLDFVTNAIISIIALINPNQIILTGNFISEDKFEYIKAKISSRVPDVFLPEVYIIDHMEEYLLYGMYYTALDLKEEYNSVAL